MSIVNVPTSETIKLLAQELKKVSDIKPPVWAAFAKTGAHTERPPTNPDWWFIRAASILVKLTNLGPIGVSKLRVKYGGKKNRGMAPERFKKGGGKNIRLILQQLEKAGLAKKASKGLRKGRIITPQGVALVDKIAYQLMKEHNIVLPKKPEAHQTTSHSQEKVAAAETVPQEQTTPTAQSTKKPRAPRKPKIKTEEQPATVAQQTNG